MLSVLSSCDMKIRDVNVVVGDRWCGKKSENQNNAYIFMYLTNTTGASTTSIFHYGQTIHNNTTNIRVRGTLFLIHPVTSLTTGKNTTVFIRL